jgi:hypothetical protein
MRTLIKSGAAMHWLVAGGLIAMLGVSAAAIWAVSSVLATVKSPDHFARAAVPGTAVVQLAAGDNPVVYYEGPDTPTASNLGLRVTSPDGELVRTSAYRGDLRYDTNGGTGRAIVTFHARIAGEYRISTTMRTGADARIAVGDSVARSVAYDLIGPALVTAAAVILALVCAAVPFTRPANLAVEAEQ